MHDASVLSKVEVLEEYDLESYPDAEEEHVQTMTPLARNGPEIGAVAASGTASRAAKPGSTPNEAPTSAAAPSFSSKSERSKSPVSAWSERSKSPPVSAWKKAGLLAVAQQRKLQEQDGTASGAAKPGTTPNEGSSSPPADPKSPPVSAWKKAGLLAIAQQRKLQEEEMQQELPPRSGAELWKMLGGPTGVLALAAEAQKRGAQVEVNLNLGKGASAFRKATQLMIAQQKKEQQRRKQAERGSPAARMRSIVKMATTNHHFELLKKAIAANSTRIETLLQEWDENGDGNIDRDEWRKALIAIGIKTSPKNIDALFEQFDDEGNGEISMDKLRVALAVRMRAQK